MNLRSCTSIIYLVFILGVTQINSQTPYNAVGHGIFIDHLDAASFGIGSSGLVPGFNSSFSIGNPATWYGLKSTYLSAHYNTGEIYFDKQEINSSFGNLSNIVFIVPIKSKYALGFGLRPITRKEFSVIDDSISTYLFSEDTLVFSKRIDGSGGMSSFYSAGSWQVNKILSVGVQLDYMFGISHEKTTAKLYENSPSTIYERSLQCKATLISLFAKVDLLKTKYKSVIYLGLRTPGKDRWIVEKVNHAYMDIDNSGNYTAADNPVISNIEEVTNTYREFPYPTSMMLGLVYNPFGRNYLSLEIVIKSIKTTDTAEYLNTFSAGFGNEKRYNLGFQKEADPSARWLFNKFHYRIGIFQREHYISLLNNLPKERGFAVGLGIPFGVTNNQIDFGIRISKRDGFLNKGQEFIRQLTIGVSLGDIWIAKKRRR